MKFEISNYNNSRISTSRWKVKDKEYVVLKCQDLRIEIHRSLNTKANAMQIIVGSLVAISMNVSSRNIIGNDSGNIIYQQ